MMLSEEIITYVCDPIAETPKRFINKNGAPMTPFEVLASLIEPIAEYEEALMTIARIEGRGLKVGISYKSYASKVLNLND